MLFDRAISARIRTLKSSSESGRGVALLKTISWRVVGTLDTITLSYLLTGTLDVAIQIGGAEVLSKMILYYLHERVWARWANS